MEPELIEANGLQFHVQDEGSGHPVILLHGFPDTGDLWRNQVPALVDHGFRAIVPDMRGRGRSSKRENVPDYRLSTIVRDVTGILDAFGIERANVVGHDWGAAVAWLVAALAPIASIAWSPSPSARLAPDRSRRSRSSRKAGTACSSCSRTSPRS
jgi:pimeloyl-ACP methyl ester carboxylesterase